MFIELSGSAPPNKRLEAWGAYVEAMPGLICPLTPLENALAQRAGGAGYSGSFIEHYLVPIIYPDGLTRAAQWMLTALVVAINVAVYVWPRRRIESRRVLGA